MVSNNFPQDPICSSVTEIQIERQCVRLLFLKEIALSTGSASIDIICTYNIYGASVYHRNS